MPSLMWMKKNIYLLGNDNTFKTLSEGVEEFDTTENNNMTAPVEEPVSEIVEEEDNKEEPVYSTPEVEAEPEIHKGN